jgi:hypothetical protein
LLVCDSPCDVTLCIKRQNYTKKERIAFLNNKEQGGELNNSSIIFNGFENNTNSSFEKTGGQFRKKQTK